MNTDSISVIKNPKSVILSESKVLKGAGSIYILCTSGQFSCNTKGKTLTIKSKSITLLTPSQQIVSIVPGPDFKGYVMALDRNYENTLDISEIHSLAWDDPDKINTKTLEDNEAETLKTYMETIQDCLKEADVPHGKECVWLTAKAWGYKMLRTFYEESQENGTEKANRQQRKEQIVKRFLNLVQEYGKAHHDLEFYASEMCISSKYLSRVISSSTGKRAMVWIEEYIIGQACQLLKTTDLTISQISYKLNFAASTDFCRYFRKRKGMTPSDYRQNG